MSAALDRLKQQTEQQEQRSELSSTETAETLNSILAALEGQNSRIDALARQQKSLAGFVKTMNEQLLGSDEVQGALPKISAELTSTSPQPASTESSESSDALSGIASTLAGMSTVLNGDSLKTSASESKAATDRLQGTAEKVIGSATKFEKAAASAQKTWAATIADTGSKANEAIETVRDTVAEVAADQITSRTSAAVERADRLLTVVGRVETRIGWLIVGRLAMSLVPVAVIALMVLGLLWPIGQVLGIGPIYSWAWSIVWDPQLFWVWRVLMALAALGSLLGLGRLIMHFGARYTAWMDDRVKRWNR